MTGDRNTNGGSQSDFIFWSLLLRPHNQREVTAAHQIAFNVPINTWSNVETVKATMYHAYTKRNPRASKGSKMPLAKEHIC